MEKVGRNDLCPCGSGKKYKKCCQEKEGRKKFTAQVISSSEDKLSRLSSSFFHKPLPPHPDKEM